MSAMTLAIPIAYILLAGLLCWIVIYAKGSWKFKLPVVVCGIFFGVAVWSAIGSYQGWPTEEGLPDKTKLLWVEIHEPNPSIDDPGYIYIWAIPLVDTDEPGVLDYHGPRGEPRAYVLGYSREMHRTLHGATEKLKRGEPVLLQRDRRPGTTDREGGNSGHDDNEFKTYDLPPAPPPRKAEE